MDDLTRDALKSWRTLSHHLMLLDEQQVLAALNWEKMCQRRVVILERLHQRYNVLRCTRERLELFGSKDK